MQNTSAAIIVAAGASRRMQGRDKLWMPLAGRVTLARTIDVFENSPLIETIILVLSVESLHDAQTLCQNEGWHKIAALVPGGVRRQDSVRAGLDVKTNIILGFPGETLADVLQTYSFIARIAAAGVEAVSIFPFSPYPGTELYDELAAAHRVRLDAAYFQSLVYTDLARMVSYNELFTTAQLRALVLVGNALFLAVQAATHPRRVLDLAMQVLRREQASKFANAIEPMRRRREVFRKLSAQVAPASTSPAA